MDSLSSKCIEEANSTDCLLRAIISFLENTQKENHAKFEWDPITFGFTVSIALIAAGFTLITVIQAVLVAGPGWRKSNSEAIGKWSKHTTRKWQFWNLGYLHIAKTPILAMGNVSAHLESVDPKAEKTDRRSESLAASAAKWLVFLDEVGLPHLELPPEFLEAWLADYLPGDLLAVPALVKVRLIYIFMSLFCKPFRVLGTDTKYPALIGKDFQFEIRQHPTLGSIATFSKYYQGSIKTSKRTTTSQLFLLGGQSEGIVPVSAGPEDMDSDPNIETILQYPELVDHMVTGTDSSIDISRQIHLPWLAHHRLCAFCSPQGATYIYDKTLGSTKPLPSLNSRSLFALMFVDIPRAIPEIFPFGKFDLKAVFEALSISANITIGDKSGSLDDRAEKRSHVLDLIFRPYGYISQPCPLHSSLVSGDGSTCRCRRIVDTCITLLQNDDVAGREIPDITAEELLQFRKDVMGFLFLVESWSRRQCSRRELRCAKFHLFSDTIQLQHVDKLLKSNKTLDKDARLSDFIRWYREYIEPGAYYQWEFDEAAEEVLLELAKPVGIKESNPQDFRANPSLDGMIPISVVKTSQVREESAIVLDFKYFDLAYENLDIVDLEKQLKQPTDGDITQPDNCLIRRVLGWRVLLLTILYMTAFDNTDMLDSGSWNQILPML